MTQKWLPGPLPRVTSSDSKVTQKWLKNDSKMGSGVTFESILGHFGVGLLESLLSHFRVTLVLSAFLWELGARWLHNSKT